MKLTLLISAILLMVNGCATLNPGYSESKPDLSKIKENKTTYKDIKNILGDPAISQMSRNKTKLQYFYNIKGANIDKHR